MNDATSPKQDISSREDISLLVHTFYEKIHADPFMAPVFQMPTEEFERHVQRTINFWENWLFQTGNYDGGMMWVHIQKHQEHPMTKKHFEHWLAWWFHSTHLLFEGPKATFVKEKALEIGNLMLNRLPQSTN